MNLTVLQHKVKHLGFLQDVFVISSGKANFNIANLQVHAFQSFADIQNQLEENPLALLEHQFAVFCSCFRSRPTISHNDRRPGITGRRTTVAVRHTTDSQYRLVHMVNQSLCFALVQSTGQIRYFGFQLRVNIPELNSPFLSQLLIIIRRNVHVMEKHECLDELFNTILAVTVRKVDSVQKRNNQLKRTDTGNVQRIFNDGNITQNMRLCLDDMRFYNLKILMVRVAAIVNYAVVIHHILDTQERLVPKTVIVHHKGVPWVKRVDFKRGIIILTYVLIWENHSERRTADMEPVSKFLILCRLLFGKHKFVKLIDCVRQIITVTTGNIL